MHASLQRLVRERAHEVCEYCRLPQSASTFSFEVDHIIAKKHEGKTIASNLALSCFYCNSFKGPNISGLDPRTARLTPLFNPGRQKWMRHFRWEGPIVVGRTAVGRATVAVLNMNNAEIVELRETLIGDGEFHAAF